MASSAHPQSYLTHRVVDGRTASVTPHGFTKAAASPRHRRSLSGGATPGRQHQTTPTTDGSPTPSRFRTPLGPLSANYVGASRSAPFPRSGEMMMDFASGGEIVAPQGRGGGENAAPFASGCVIKAGCSLLSYRAVSAPPARPTPGATGCMAALWGPSWSDYCSDDDYGL